MELAKLIKQLNYLSWTRIFKKIR